MDTVAATRRQFLKGAGVLSVAVPGSYSAAAGLEVGVKSAAKFNENKKKVSLVRNFNSDILELGRILKEVTEVEHSLMLQYLYAGFSVNPKYSSIVGYGAPDSTSLLGIAVQEMQHLSSVNRLMVQLGFSPNLSTQDFPFEYDIYPFSMTLEPLSLTSSAKYAYCESPPLLYDASSSGRHEDKIYQDVLERELGKDLKINRVGSVYEVVIDMFVDLTSKSKVTLDRDYWIEELKRVMDQGEHDHYNFFRSLVTEEHPIFKENAGLWYASGNSVSISYKSAINPTAFVNHPNSIEDADLRKLAWLGNLYYWCTLILLDLYYRDQDTSIRDIALMSMMGPLKVIGQTLASKGSGMPFDKLSIGTNPCCSKMSNLNFCIRLLQEAATISSSIGSVLPQGYPAGIENVIRTQLLDKVSNLKNKSPSTTADTLISVVA